MSKDHENVLLPLSTPDGSPAVSGVQRFTAEQMVACKSCLRTNPPTRVNCFYCGTALPVHAETAGLQKPELRPLENWEQGYNNILKPPTATNTLSLGDRVVAEVADLLKLEPDALARIVSANIALPLARSATRDEATLVQRRLSSLGIETSIVADVNLVADNTRPFRVRALEISEAGIKALERPGSQPVEVLWTDVLLFVVGRLTVQRVESREERTSKTNRKLDSSQFFSDETIFDFYTAEPGPFRILAKSFDFSCLGQKKGLLAEENMSTLLALFRENATSANWDDSYNPVRKALEAVWPSERNDQSAGWRRDRPGKLTKGSVTEITNEAQFQKYSRLRRYLTSPT